MAPLTDQIAELERQVEAHRQAEASLRLVLDSAGEAIYCADRDGALTFCNRAFLDLLGYDDADEVLGTNSHDLLHHTRPDGTPYPVEECRIYQAFREGAGTHLEDEVMWRKDGTSLPAEYRSYPIRRDGELLGCVVTFVDITERKESARRLREQTDVLRTLNETNAVLAAELDLDRLVQRLVDAGREVVGADVGAFFYDVERHGDQVHYALSGVSREAFARYPLPRTTEGILRIGDALTDPRYDGNDGEDGTDGGTHSMPPPARSFLSAPVKDRHGVVIGGLTFGHPEPDRFTAEHEALLAGVASQAAIAIANARLYEAAQTEIEERRRAEAALAEARDRAEAANRAKSAFLAKMSHELRTPLNGILGYAQLLGRDEALADEHRAGLDVIERSGHHLLGLINDVLDLAKIEAGKLEVRPAPVRLPDLLRSVAALARVEADAKGLAFATDLAPALPSVVHADERRLRQVLLNLLSNAVKFTPRGTVTLRAHADEEVPGDERRVVLRFEVIDTGIGIAPEQAERVFQPFEQVADTGGHSEGTGLGLAISRRREHVHRPAPRPRARRRRRGPRDGAPHHRRGRAADGPRRGRQSRQPEPAHGPPRPARVPGGGGGRRAGGH
jgi:PAS domain S-box-containing protein